MLKLAVLSALLGAVAAGWKPDPPPIDGTSEAVFNATPAVIQARKMAKLVPSQDIVTTCRYILFKTPLPYPEARDSCAMTEWPITHTGIGMASVQSLAENRDIITIIRIAFGIHFDKNRPYKLGSWATIGLTKRINNDRKLTKDEKGKFRKEEWFYENGQQAKYGNFHRQMPDQQRKGRGKNEEYQVVVQVNKKGYWDDTFASKPLPYLCQYCGKYIVLSKHVRWSQAKKHCGEVGLEFATVNSADENRELFWAAEMALGEELGGRRFNNSNWVWIGEVEQMDENNEGTGVWTHHDGTEIQYTPKWDFKRQPDNWVKHRGEQSVVAFSRKDGKWDDSFSFKKRPFACMCPTRACHF